MDDLETRLREHADECEADAKERAQTEGNGLHYMNTCDWAYAIAFRSAADEIERLQEIIRERGQHAETCEFHGECRCDLKEFQL